MAKLTNGPTRLNRGGFTLIEMMAVILIIGILAALILPAISSVRRSARVGAVSAELNQLSAAITQFRNTYGTEPPSSIGLYTAAAGWQGDPNSMAKIRRLWPNFDFSMSSGAVPSTWAAANTLTGAECLVFFLGGINTSGIQPQGFSKNPAAPFSIPGSDTRDGPYYDFKSSRFMDFDADGFSEYKDSIPSQQLPIVYASSYEGQGYAVVDLIVTGSADLSLPYQAPTPLANRSALMPKSFQLISPGMDFTYGTGGVWAENFSAVIANDVQPVGLYPDAATSQTARLYELDNITNFSTGTLGGR